MPEVIRIEDNNELVPTSTYPHAKWKFENFNPVQSRLIDIYSSDANVTIAAATASGKAQPLYSKILTPSGFKTMGEIQVGDQVIGSKGLPVTVKGVFPQGAKSVYKVTFKDGSSTVSCGEHLWCVRNKSDKYLGKQWRVKPLSDLIGDLYNGEGYKWHIPLLDLTTIIENESYNHEQSGLTLHPYVLGVLLGDGGIKHQVVLSSADEEIVENMRMLLPAGVSIEHLEKYDYAIRNGMYETRSTSSGGCVSTNLVKKLLKNLGLFGLGSCEKFIPKNYLYASPQARLELLRGLMDTDGSANPKGAAEYSTCSFVLANDVCQLIRSLGGFCRVCTSDSGYVDKDGNYIECEDRHRIAVNLGYLNPFKMSRKQKIQQVGYERGMNRSIVAITNEGQAECQCISVDAPDHLYVTDDYILTHNTISSEIFAAYEIRKNKKKMLYIGPLKSLVKEKHYDWTKADYHFGDLKVSICSGDYRLTNNRIKELENAHIIVMTPEMLASRCRNHKSEKSQFLHHIGCVVFDESHLLGVPGRGDHIEVALMKLCEINPDCRVIMLSATLPNVSEVCEWVSKLTGRNTYYLESKYRPCPLHIHYEKYFDGGKKYEDKETEKVGAAVGIVNYYSEDKFLVFVHTKRTGQMVLAALKRAGIDSEFHNADLDAAKRDALEKKFKEDPKFRCIVATSTLAWGVNLPSRRVVIVGVDRGLSPVENYDIWQMCVAETSRIMVSGGYVKASDIKIGDEIISRTDSNTLAPAKVVDVYSSEKEVKHFSFSNGTAASFSDHPLLLWDGSWVSSDKIVVGDKVCVATNIPGCSGLDMRDFLHSAIKGIDCRSKIPTGILSTIKNFLGKRAFADCLGVKVKSIYKTLRTGVISTAAARLLGVWSPVFVSQKAAPLDVDKFDNDFAYVLGLLATDGNVQKNKSHQRIRLSNNNLVLINKFSNIMTKYGLRVSISKYGKKYEACCSGRPLINMVEQLGLKPKKTWNMDLSPLLSMSNDCLGRFMCGVIDGDGHYGYTIRICTASYKTAYFYKECLLRLGIVSNIRQFEGSGQVYEYPCDTSHFFVSVTRKEDINKLIRIKCSVKLPKQELVVKKNSRPIKGELWYTTVENILPGEKIKVVNFSVDTHNTFIVEDLVTHNCGRAGRPAYDPRGDVYILVPESQEKDVIARLNKKNPIRSQLLDDVGGHHKTLAFHIVSEIHHGNVKTKEGFHDWFKRSFASHQNQDFSDAELDRLIELLVKCKAVTSENDEYKVTTIGTVASMFYFSPFDVADLKNNFNKLFEKGLEKNDYHLAVALADIDDNRWGIVNKNEKAEMLQFQMHIETLYGRGTIKESAIKTAFGYYNLITGKDNPVFGALQAGLRADSERTIEVLNAIDSMSARWNEGDYLNTIRMRLTYGVRAELVDLCRIPNVGKVRAERLFAVGVQNMSDFVATHPDKLSLAMNLTVEKVKEAQDAARGIKLKEMMD